MNKEELENLSDFEINTLVHKKWNLINKMPPDYCNNPADIMPIAIENEIDTMFLPCRGNWVAREARDINIHSIDINPLRAACIVFLLMQER